MKSRFLLILILFLQLTSSAYAAPRARDFNSVCDSLRLRLKERMSVDQELKMTRVAVKGNSLDLHFS